jgi:hypothetical protein
VTRKSIAAAIFTLAVALLIGVWAEFADLGQALLVSVALPVIAVATPAATLGLARTTRGRAIAALGCGLLLGTALGVLGEGTYLALHFARGGELNFEGFSSQPAMAMALLGIHTLAGLSGGAIVGTALAAAFVLTGLARPQPVDRSSANPWTA